jgi:hypothetical protein
MEDNIGGPLTKMPTKLKDTLEKVRKLDTKPNSGLLIEFYEYLRAVRTSERYQIDILKVLVKFSVFIDDDLMNIQKKEQVILLLPIQYWILLLYCKPNGIDVKKLKKINNYYRQTIYKAQLKIVKISKYNTLHLENIWRYILQLNKDFHLLNFTHQ